MGKGREGWDGGGMLRGTEVAKEGERIGKGEGWLDLHICTGASEFLVTPLLNIQWCDSGRWTLQTCRRRE